MTAGGGATRCHTSSHEDVQGAEAGGTEAWPSAWPVRHSWLQLKAGVKKFRVVPYDRRTAGTLKKPRVSYGSFSRDLAKYADARRSTPNVSTRFLQILF